MAKKYGPPRTATAVFLFLQLVSTMERQVFDFLGYMWLPILGNFFNMICVIFGIFGLFQYRSNYLLTYIIWEVLWIPFNIFIVCLYSGVFQHDDSEVGRSNPAESILNFGTGSFSWWLINSPGCQPV